MSWVTDIILITEVDDNESQGLKEFIETYDLKSVDGHAGGRKAVQADVFMAAHNGLDINKMLLEWAEILNMSATKMQLLYQDENDDGFKLYEKDYD